MLALFREDRWIANFHNANKMAALLGSKLKEKGITICYPVESNTVFCVLEEAVLEKVRAKYDLKYWTKDKKMVRIATTLATTEEDILDLVSAI